MKPSMHQPFFDAECHSLERVERNAKDPIARKSLDRHYHSVVRSKQCAYQVARLHVLATEQKKVQSRSFWKLLRSKNSPLRLALQQVQQ